MGQRMSEWIDGLLDFVAHHKEWALVIVFLIGVVETLVVIGNFVPGTAFMLGIGVLVGHGELDLGTTGLALIVGGVVGDYLGYWIGHRYRSRILNLRFFRKRQGLVKRAERMTELHGGKAVFTARFIGQMRTIVPFMAGVVGMTQGKFLFYNVTSSIISAFVHLALGMAIGLGLSVSGAITGRLVALIVLLFAAILLVNYFSRWFFNRTTIDAPVAIERWLVWAHQEPPPAGLGARLKRLLVLHLFDARYRPALEFASLGVFALLSLIGVGLLISSLGAADPLTAANGSVRAFFAGLRNPFADNALAVLAALGEGWVLVALAGVIALCLVFQRVWRVAGNWLLAAGLGYGSAAFILWLLDWVAPGLESVPRHAFPSGEAAALVITLGYLALLSSQRFAAFAVAASAIALINVAQLYFGTLYISGLFSGLLLGGAWLALLVATTRDYLTAAHPLWSDVMGGVSVLVLAIAGALQATVLDRGKLPVPLEPPPIVIVAEKPWLEHVWQELPAYRVDLMGEPEEAINVQLAGTPARIEAAIEQAGWRKPVRWNAIAMLRLISGAGLEGEKQRPVLPRLLNGQREALRFVREGAESRLILRLWDLGYRLDDASTPLYLGTVEEERFRPPLIYGLVRLPPYADGFMPALSRLAEDLERTPLPRAIGWRPAHGDDAPIPWNGATLVTRF